MGESYRGLTIKIGADTTNLSTALRGANKAIRQTQSELSKINKGLKFDTESVMLAKAKLNELGDRAGQTQAKLALMKKELNQLKGSAVEKIATETKNLALTAATVTEEYNRINTELASVYQHCKQVATANGQAWDKKKPQECAAQLKELNLITDEVYDNLKRLWAMQGSASASDAVYKEALRYKDLTVEIARAEAELKSYAAQKAALKTETWEKENAQVRALKQNLVSLEGTAGTLATELKAMQTALDIDPSSMEAFSNRAKTLADSIDVAEQKTKALKQAIAGLKDSGIDTMAKSTSQLNAELEESRQNYIQAAAAVEKLTGELSEAEQAARNFAADTEYGKTSQEYKEAAAQVKTLTERLNQLRETEEQAGKSLDTAYARTQLRAYTTQLQEAENELAQLQRQQSSLSASSGVAMSALKSIGMTAYSTVSPAIMTLGQRSVDAANEIDSSFRDMKKTVNGTAEDFEHLRESALNFSRTNAVSADTILEIEAMGGQLGIAVENLEAFGTVVSNLDIATNVGADEMAEDLGQLNNILPDLNDNYEAFGDALVRLGNNMPAQESAIMDITSRIGSMGGIVGMSTPQVLAWSTAIAATGQNSEAAGTAISNTMSDIETSVSKGGDTLQSFADVAGMSAEEFAQSWNETPSTAMQAFVEGLHRIDEEGGSVDTTLQDLGITGVRQKQALEGLAQTTDVLNDALTMSEDAWNGVSDEWGDAGDAAREASQKSEGFSGTLQILKNSASEFGYELGNALVPFMQTATSALQTLTDGFKSLPSPVKDAVVAMGLLGASSGAVITSFASLAPVIQKSNETLMDNVTASRNAQEGYKKCGVNLTSFYNGLSKLSNGTKLATAATKGLNAALTALKGAAGMVAFVALDAAISATASAIDQYNTKVKNTEASTTGLQSAIAKVNTTTASNALDTMGKSADSVSSYTKQATMTFDEFLQKQADLASSFDEQSTSLAATKGQLDEYKSVVDSLNGTYDGSADGAGKLKSAIDKINESCGTNYEVVQNDAGAYVVMKDGAEEAVTAIDKVIDAQKRQAEAEVLQEQYKSLYSSKVEAAKQYSDALNELNQVQSTYNEAVESGQTDLTGFQVMLDNANKKVDEAKQQLDTTSGSLDKVSQQENIVAAAALEGASANTQFAASSDELKAALMNASGSSTEFISAMDSAGISLQSLSDTNQDALMSLASAWDGNIGSIIDKAAELGDQLPQETQDAISKMAQGITNATPEVVSAAATACNMTTGEFANLAQSTGLSGEQAISAFTQAVQSGVEPATAAAAAVAAGANSEEGLAAFKTVAAMNSQEAMERFVDNIRNKGMDAQSAAAELNNAADGELGNLSALAAEDGAEGGQSFADGLSGKSGEASGAGSEVSGAGESGLWENSDGSGAGSSLGSSFASGESSESGAAESAGREVASSAGTGLQSENGSARGWGSDLASNFISGLGSMVSAAASAASGLMSTIAGQMHFSEPEKGVWSGSEHGGITSGRHLVQNFAAGMIAEVGTVSSASSDVATAAADALQDIQDVPTLGIKAVITEVSLADGVSIMGNLEAAALASRAAVSSAAAQSAASNAGTVVIERQVSSSNAELLSALNELNTKMQSYTEAVESQETVMYVDGKKLASTLAKPMNKQLGQLSRRGM